MDNKKGTGRRPAPKMKKQVDYSRVMNVCIVTNLISIIILFIGICMSNKYVMVFGVGLFIGIFLVEAVINPIEED